jgi:hypothetical protein
MTLLACVFAVFVADPEPTGAAKPFAIEVVDRATGRGVPLIELTTVHGVRYVTDSAGLVAFDEPGLMDQSVFFHVKGHGYSFPKDGFGIAGKAMKVTPGGTGRIEVDRVNIAERLYRVTGGGIYADSVRLGRPTPIENPVLNALVLGSDSVQTAVFRGKVRWFWGDTNRPGYPLGNFNTPGASSVLPSEGGLDPAVGVNLDYEIDPKTGFAAEVCRMAGEGPTWLGGLVVEGDAPDDRLLGSYVKVRPGAGMIVYEHGATEFDPDTRRFKHLKKWPEGRPYYPTGHPFRHRDGDTEFDYFPHPYPHLRVRATADDYLDLDRYEGYTPLVAGTRVEDRKIERDGSGAIVYGWKWGTPPLDLKGQKEYIDAGLMRPDEAFLRMRDIETGAAVQVHGSSVAWNAYRRRWVMIFMEVGGSSFLGEGWYAESDRPEGPWGWARKILTHDKYSFYNPRHHPFFDRDGGRTVFFEGTYTITFSGNQAEPTPRYDYNQIMYRLDLSDPRLNLPIPVRRPDGSIRYYACDRPGPGLVEVEKGVFLASPDGDPKRFPTADFEVPGKVGKPIGRGWDGPGVSPGG